MKRVVSPLVLFVIGAAATLGLAINAEFGAGSDSLKATLSGIGTVGITLLCAVTVFVIALGFGPREPWRRQWLFVGAGVSSFALSRLVVAVTPTTVDPAVFGPTADIFALAEYFFLAAALAAVVEAYVKMVDYRRAAIISIAFGLVFIAVFWFGVVDRFVIEEVDGFDAILAQVLRPAADILVLLAPAMFVAMCLAQIGGSRFALPWWILAAGAAVLALSDAGAIAMRATGYYWEGSWIDYGPSSAQLLIAMGALFAGKLGEEFMGRPGGIAPADLALADAPSPDAEELVPAGE